MGEFLFESILEGFQKLMGTKWDQDFNFAINQPKKGFNKKNLKIFAKEGNEYQSMLPLLNKNNHYKFNWNIS